MNSLDFEIKPSPETNDHELRIIIDEIDWLGKDYLGLDPPDFFREKNLFENGNLLIGRCDCGCIGCCDYEVKMTISDETVIWTTFENLQLTFDKKEYFRIIRKASEDFSWEDLNRRVERLVAKIFVGKLIENKYLFDGHLQELSRILSNYLLAKTVCKICFSSIGMESQKITP